MTELLNVSLLKWSFQMGIRSDNHKMLTAYFERFTFNKSRHDNRSASFKPYYIFESFL